ncbi:MAG TPA: PAS domain-containing sensor histidine kinase [Gemmatimonadaceae bacterium]|nr:PAS domain-containing sensor histidine kinase [Gemmatimonadaceae bacterium]
MPVSTVPDHVLASVLHIASDAVLCVDEAQVIRFFNDGAARIFGYSAADVLGQPLSLLLPSRFHGSHAEHIRRFGGGDSSARRMSERSPIFGRRQNGEEFSAEAAIVRVAHGDAILFAVVMRDVTEQRRNEAVVQQALTAAESAVRDRDDMLGLVSHDLRNPVNAMKMLASALLRIPADESASTLPAAASEHASVMLQAATQMDTLIQDLLDVTRLERGQLRIARRPEAIGALMLITADLLAPLAQARRVTLETDVEAGLPLVDIDADRIAQVLSNLVGNAIKFTPEGGRVTLRGQRQADGVQIVVHDTGTGIAAADLPFIFDRFWQSKRTDRSGAGLGLAIARGIVNAHGGTLTLESEIGRGTSAVVTLPAAERIKRQGHGD